MKPPASPPVPVWLFDEQQARRAFARFTAKTVLDREYARRRFHASFRRLA